MAREEAGTRQKLKLLYLLKILQEYTDEEHTLSREEITEKLEQEGIKVERKTFYSDLNLLEDYGIDIQKTRGQYNLITRDFELPELKLMVDAVQSAKFISERKSRDLIGKIGSMASRYERQVLSRQVMINGRVKTADDTAMRSLDQLHLAINQRCQVRFRYYQWTPEKKLVARHDGAVYQVSPWLLVRDAENYYLIAYDSESGRIKHYRVDKMRNVQALTGDGSRRSTAVPSEGEEIFRSSNPEKYGKRVFGMFGGEEIQVTVEAENSLASVFIDRFGKDDVTIQPLDENHFRALITVVGSAHFLGWIFSIGEGKDIRIVSPESLAEKMRGMAQRAADLHMSPCKTAQE